MSSTFGSGSATRSAYSTEFSISSVGGLSLGRTGSSGTIESSELVSGEISGGKVSARPTGNEYRRNAKQIFGKTCPAREPALPAWRSMNAGWLGKVLKNLKPEKRPIDDILKSQRKAFRVSIKDRMRCNFRWCIMPMAIQAWLSGVGLVREPAWERALARAGPRSRDFGFASRRSGRSHRPDFR